MGRFSESRTGAKTPPVADPLCCGGGDEGPLPPYSGDCEGGVPWENAAPQNSTNTTGAAQAIQRRTAGNTKESIKTRPHNGRDDPWPTILARLLALVFRPWEGYGLILMNDYVSLVRSVNSFDQYLSELLSVLVGSPDCNLLHQVD